jgi:predicted N-formylglutamate amidohydrolase
MMAEHAKDHPKQSFVISCEHGGNQIPLPYRELFNDHQTLLDTHRGYDPGALIMAEDLASALAAPLVSATVSRLLVDLNRSVGNPNLHYQTIRTAPVELRELILKQYYQPYRTQAEHLVRSAIENTGQVTHLSSHSFTPELHGKIRNADIGLLYDPRRPGEVALCERWKAAFKLCAPDLAVRRNYPYAGKNDGLTAWFRRRLSPENYIGIEIEINQKHIRQADQDWTDLRKLVIKSLRTALASA